MDLGPYHVDGLEPDTYITVHKDAILIMAKGENSLYIPHGETYLRTGDVLYIFGTDSALDAAREKLG